MISNGKEIYNCTKCAKDYTLKYDKKLNINICDKIQIYEEEIKTNCYVSDCEECYPDDIYNCSKCSSGYELNKYTSSCLPKITTAPSVTWQSIYSINMNNQKEIQGKKYNGPSIKLRGIAESKINSDHIFLINLIFKIKHNLRSLQDIIYVTAICQIVNVVEKTEDDIYVVDYECIGNTTINDNYVLSGIEEIDNKEIKSDGISKINKIINQGIQSGANITEKSNNSVIQDSVDIAVFAIEENEKNKSSINGVFNFNLSGTINKDISLSPQNVYDVEIEMYNITDKPNFKLYMGNNRNAKLNVYLELKNDKNKENIYFKNTEIKISDDKYLYAPVLNELTLKNDKVIQAVSADQQKDNGKKNDGGNFKKNILILAISLLLLELF